MHASRITPRSMYYPLLTFILMMSSTPQLPGNTASAAPVIRGRRVGGSQRLKRILSEYEADSVFMSSKDVGVAHFKFEVSNLRLGPGSPEGPWAAQVHIFAKYSHWEGTAVLKGFVSSETRDLQSLPALSYLQHTACITPTQPGQAAHCFTVQSQVSKCHPPHASATPR